MRVCAGACGFHLAAHNAHTLVRMPGNQLGYVRFHPVQLGPVKVLCSQVHHSRCSGHLQHLQKRRHLARSTFASSKNVVGKLRSSGGAHVIAGFTGDHLRCSEANYALLGTERAWESRPQGDPRPRIADRASATCAMYAPPRCPNTLMTLRLSTTRICSHRITPS